MSRITEKEDRRSEVEDKMVEINEAERKKEKRIKRNEDGRSQDGVGIGRGDHFLFYKFIERTIER